MQTRLLGAIGAAAVFAALGAREAAHLTAARAEASAAAAAGATAVVKGEDGHFWAEGAVNGEPVRFLVDTGATVIALTQADAARVGIDPSGDFERTSVSTAAGVLTAARIALDEVAVGAVARRDVDAIIVTDGLTHSLLGMSYLGDLSRIEATPDTLVLMD